MSFDRRKITVLDGAMGTMLQQAGLRPGEAPEKMNFERPDVIVDIHRQYVEAGSQVIYANTFGANARKLRASGHRVNETILRAVSLARQASQGRALVALDVGPIGELLEPMGTLTFEEAYDLFAEMMRAGDKAGADLIAIETMTDLQEARAALLAAKEQTRLPVLVTMSFEENVRTMTGCTVSAMARTLAGLGADALGVNCSLGPDKLAEIVREMRVNTALPIVAKPNAGLPDPVTGGYSMSPEAFARAMRALVEAGASVIGGCCGTSPAYIRALRAQARDMRVGDAEMERVSFVCTPANPLYLRDVAPIGERINPTGKKRLQQALLSGDLDYVVGLAVQQKDAGAAMLDVNVGYPGVDEAAMLPLLVKRIQAAVDLPLMLDSTQPEALSAALRVYQGKAAVNSVNGDPAVCARILPVVKKYGVAVVGLTMDENGLPATCEERLNIARRIVTMAGEAGIPPEDVWIDCLTLTVSAQQRQAQETLEAVRRVRGELGLQTVLGVSNISFGLPSRPLMTQVFLAEALRCGLTLPIVNPNQQAVMDTIAAHRALSGADEGCADYVSRFAGRDAPAPQPQAGGMTLEEAVRRGLKSEAKALARQALQTEDELALVEKTLIPALDRVGEDYESGRAYLPQLLSAAQAAQGVFEVIRQHLAERGGKETKRGRLIVATVKGDIHDIGKNIVRVVLENYGYEVIDLGRDVPPETVAQTAQREGIRLVGLSALMTTTLPSMAETIRQLKELPEPPIVFVGGAVLTEGFASEMGADFYARDARASVEIARKVFG